MARWFLCDLVTGRQLLDLPVLDGSWSLQLNAPGQMECTLNLEDPDVRALGLRNSASPVKAVLGVVEHGVLVEAGPIWVRAYDRDAQKLKLSAKGIWSVLDHRIILPAAALTLPVTQFTIPDPSDTSGSKTMPNPAVGTHLTNLWLGTIAKRLIQQAFAWSGGTLPITLPADIAGTNQRDFEGAQFGSLGQALQQLTQVDGGPDIKFVPQVTTDGLGIKWVMLHGTPQQPLLYSSNPVTFDMSVPESKITGLTVQEDASAMASLSWATGGRAGDSVLVSRATQTAQVSQGYPLLEVLDSSHSDVVLQPTLDAYAQENLTVGSVPVEIWKFNVELDGSPDFSDYTVGDIVNIIVGKTTDPYLQPGTYQQRIVSLAGDHRSTVVQVGCAPGAPGVVF
jgi:hypothetical protein